MAYSLQEGILFHVGLKFEYEGKAWSQVPKRKLHFSRKQIQPW